MFEIVCGKLEGVNPPYFLDMFTKVKYKISIETIEIELAKSEISRYVDKLR